MTTPCSGAISLSQIDTEFADGGTNPSSISSFYGAASGVPASGQISFSDLYCKSSFTQDAGRVIYAEAFIAINGYQASTNIGTISDNISLNGWTITCVSLTTGQLTVWFENPAATGVPVDAWRSIIFNGQEIFNNLTPYQQFPAVNAWQVIGSFTPFVTNANNTVYFTYF